MKRRGSGLLEPGIVLSAQSQALVAIVLHVIVSVGCMVRDFGKAIDHRGMISRAVMEAMVHILSTAPRLH